jgi:hypothetical protein
MTVLAGLLAVQVPEPPAAGLVWEAPRGCPGREELLAAVERRLGRAFTGEVKVEARVSQQADAPRYRLVLRIATRGRGAARTLTSQRCAALVDATALLVATAARREAEVAEAAPAAAPAGDAAGEVEIGEAMEVSPPTPESEPEPAAQGSEPAPEPPATEEGAMELEVAGPLTTAVSSETPLQAPGRPRRPLGGALRVQGGPEYGALPGVSAAVMLAGGLLWRRARLELRGTFLTPRTKELQPEGELRAFAGLGAVLGCGRLGPKRVEIPLCGGLEVGGVRGIAQGVPGARSTTGLWLAVVASVGVAVPVHPRVRVGAALEGVAGILVPRFELRDPGLPVPLFASSLISGRLLFAVELRFRDPR